MRVFVFALAFILIALQSRLWLSDGGLRELRAMRASVAAQSARNAELAERNDALAGEVRDLKQGIDAAEERARSDLGMVREDETFFLVVTRDGAD
jgi:cell division protein FtsB